MLRKMCLAAALVAAMAAQAVTIFMIGDSTMANKPVEGDNPERGWGQVLPGFLSPEITVDNHAVNGRSSKSFIDEGRWDAVLQRLQPGDYVFIQFGHNDEKPQENRHTDPGSTFDDNLRRFVIESRQRGAIPVLFNSIVRRNFKTADQVDLSATSQAQAIAQDDAFYANPDARRAWTGEADPAGAAVLVDTHGAYLLSPLNVAREMNVPFVDMNLISKCLVEGLGPELSKSLFVWVEPNTVAAIPKGREDNTHLNIHGARTLTALTIDAIAETIPALVPYVRHYDIVIAPDGSGDYLTLDAALPALQSATAPTTVLIR